MSDIVEMKLDFLNEIKFLGNNEKLISAKIKLIW